MDIGNIEKAKALIPQIETLKKARKLLSDDKVEISVCLGLDMVKIPVSLRLNIINVVNCEYERVRKELERL